MAVDTAAKRFSMLDFDLPTQPGMEPPDGTINRSTYLWLYSGIALGGAAAASGSTENELWRVWMRRRA